LALGLSAMPAAAALTDGEKAQIQGFVRGAELGNAPRVRALIARPENAAGEATAPLSAGYGAVPFDDAREKFTRELLLGAGSLPSRSAVAPLLTEALLARAAAALKAMPAAETGADAAKAARLAAEIVRIHRFITEAIANAGSPPPDGHDVSAGFRDDAFKAMLEAYRRHLEALSAFIGYGKPLSPSLVPVRAQASLAVVDLARGVLPRHEVAALLGLTGERRSVFERHGALLEDGGTASETRLVEAVRYAQVAPRALDGLGLWLISKAPAVGLSGRRPHATARVTLGSKGASGTEDTLWPDDITPSRPDRELSEVAYSAAWITTRSAFASKPRLREIAQRIAERAARTGRAGYLSVDLPGTVLRDPGAENAGAVGASPELFTAHALRLLLVDAPRALDLALLRSTQGRDEPLAALVLALSVLHEGSGLAPDLMLSRTKADGELERHALVGLKNENSLVSAFQLGETKVEVTLLSEGRIDKVQVDGAAPKLSKLASARLVPTAKGPWQWAGQRLEVLSGEPLGLVVDDGRLILGAPPKSAGFEAVVTGEVSSDQAVHAQVKVSGRGGGLLVRGQAGTTSYDGIGLLVTEQPSPSATLVLVDGKSKAVELAPPVPLPPAGPDGYALSLQVKGQKVTAVVDDKTLNATLTRGVGTGRYGMILVAGGQLEAKGLAKGALKPTKPKPKKSEPASKKAKGTDKKSGAADGKKSK